MCAYMCARARVLARASQSTVRPSVRVTVLSARRWKIDSAMGYVALDVRAGLCRVDLKYMYVAYPSKYKTHNNLELNIPFRKINVLWGFWTGRLHVRHPVAEPRLHPLQSLNQLHHRHRRGRTA